jgi:hypothetical protein
MRASYQKEKGESTYNIMYVPFILRKRICLWIQCLYRSVLDILEILTLQDSQLH